jgi:4-oxalocrotonate tautomerase
MPSIHVHLFEGRTLEQKRAYAAALTEATVRVLGGSPESVDVLFTDVARHDWATAGVLWSDKPSSKPAAPPPAETLPTG